MNNNNRKFNIEQLIAYEHAYGGKLTRKRRAYLILYVVAIYPAFTYLILNDWLIALATSIIAGIFAYFRFLPKQVREDYYERGYLQRNIIVNHLSQSLSDLSVSYDVSLEMAKDALEGSENIEDEDYNELKYDMSVLVANLSRRVGEAETVQYLRQFRDKYAYDTFFVMFFEQVETRVLEGTVNSAVLIDLMELHNSLYQSQTAYVRELKMNERVFKLISGLALIILAGGRYFIVPQVGEAYVNKIFFQNFMGYFTFAVFLITFTLTLLSFYSSFFDRNIMSLSSKRKIIENGRIVNAKPDNQAGKKPVNPILLRAKAQEREDKLRAGTWSQLSMKMLTLSERRMLKRIHLDYTNTALFQRRRVFLSAGASIMTFIFMIIFTGKIVNSLVMTGLVGFGIYYLQRFQLKNYVDTYILTREMAFAKLMRMLTPYILDPVPTHPVNLFDKVGRRLDSEQDRGIVNTLIINIIRTPLAREPYLQFANEFSGDPRSTTRMLSIYNVLNFDGHNEVIEVLAKQSDSEFKYTVREIISKKIERFSAIGVRVLLMGLIPFFLLIGTIVARMVMQTFSQIHV